MVRSDPCPQQLIFRPWNDVIQALLPPCAQEPFIDRSRLGTRRRRFRDRRSQVAYALVEWLRADGLSIMDRDIVVTV